MSIDTVKNLSSSVKRLLLVVECVVIISLITSLVWNLEFHVCETPDIYFMHGVFAFVAFIFLLFTTFTVTRLLKLHEERVIDSVEALKSVTCSNRLLSGVIDSFNNPLMVVDPHTKQVTMANSAAKDIGWEKGVCCYAAFSDCHEQCGDDMSMCPLNVVMSSREEFKKSLPMKIHGVNHYVQLNSFPVINADKEVESVIMYFIDLTDYREALQSLEERKVKYWGLFESCPVSLWEEDFSKVKEVLDELQTCGVNDFSKYLDDHPEFIYRCAGLVEVNDINTKTLLLHKAESKKQLLESLQVTFGPDAYRAFRLQLVKIWNHEHNLTCEATVKSLNGDRLDVIMYWQVLPNSEMDYSNVVVSLIDVTESKRSFRELAERERTLNRLSIAVEQSSSTVVITSTSGDIEFVNNSVLELTGYTRQELIGQNPRIFKSGEFDDEIYASLWETLKSGGMWKGTFHNRRKDGTLYWEESSISPIIESDGNISGYLKVGENVTSRLENEKMIRDERANLAKTVDERTAELLQLNLELAQANKHKSEFIANVSHELRTPLNGILGYCQILQRGNDLDRDNLYGVKVIQQCGESLLELINEILDMSKVEAGKLTFEKAVFNLPLLLDTLDKLFSMKALDREIVFESQFAPDLPVEVEFDQQRLRQVLSNLLNNAINYTDSGSVTFTVSFDGDKSLSFDVSDTGTGIAEEELQRIFEPFYQVKGGDKFREGTGLGLAISYKIVELFDSVLNVESEIGCGTRFWFDIECSILERSSSPSPNEMPHVRYVGYEGDRKRILIVDDIEINRLLLVNILQKLEFVLDEADCGKSAIRKLKENEYDMILLDMKLPDMNGTGVLTYMKEAGGFENCRVIAISAGVFEENITESISAGCDLFVAKPFNTQELLEGMAHLLEIDLIMCDNETVIKKTDVDLSGLDEVMLDQLLAAIRRGSLSSIINQLSSMEKNNIITADTFTTLNEVTMNFDFAQLKKIIDRERR